MITPFQFKRLDDLLRRALCAASAPNERTVALEEALRIVTKARAGTVEFPWKKYMAMRHEQCSLCEGKILPMRRAYQRGEGEYAHESCYMDAVSTFDAV